MPAKPLMSWEPKARRWWKKYHKSEKRIVVSCRQLSEWAGEPVPETKEGSYQYTNRWWLAKKAEIDGQQPPHPHAADIDEMIRRRDWSRRQGDNDLARFWDTQAKATEHSPDTPSVLQLNRHLWTEILRGKYGLDPGRTPPEVLDYYLSDDQVWEERYARDRGGPVPDDQTIDGQVERWLSRQEARVRAGTIVPGTFSNKREGVRHFRDWIGGDMPASAITEDRIEDYHTYLLGKIGEREADPDRKKGWSREYAREVFSVARSFIRYLWERSLIQLPKNMGSHDLRFKVGPKAIVTMTDDEVRTLVTDAK